MKNLFKILILSLLVFSCDSDNNPTESTVNPIIGVWDQITQNVDGHGTYIFTFSEGGIFSYQYQPPIDGEGESQSGGETWSTTDNKLTLVIDGDESVIDFSIIEDILTLIWTDDDGTVVNELQFMRQ
jgi:hypothetical protein